MNFSTKVIFLLLLFNVVALAHSGNIRGVVTDSTNGKPLQFVNVMLISTGLGAATNEAGEYFLNNVPEGTYMLKYSHLGYQSVTKKITLLGGEDLVINIIMKQTSFNLSEITVTSGLNPNKIFTTINQIDIELRPISSSQDILPIVPGLVIAQHGGGGKAEQIFLRGFDNDHGTDIDISVDGIPVNMVSHAHGQGYADLHFLIPETIGIVDFNKGPYYADHGDFNTTGYVDFQTKNNIGNSLIKIEGGQFNTFRTVALVNVLGSNSPNHNAYLAAEYLYTDGYFDAPLNFNRLNFFAKYTGRVSELNLLSISASNFSTKWDQSGQIPNRAVEDYKWISRFGALDKTEGGNTGRTNINVKLNTTVDNSTFLKNQVFYTNYNFTLFSNFTFFLNDTTNGDQIHQDENRQIYGYKGMLTHLSKLFNKDLQSAVGLGIRYDAVRDVALYNTLGRNILIRTKAFGDVDETNINIFYDGSLQITNKLSLNLGLRYDYFIFEYIDNTKEKYTNPAKKDGIFSPKLNLFYHLNNNAQIYLKSGAGFHSNDARSVVYNEVKESLPRALGIDIGSVFKPSENIFINIAGWFIYLESELVYVGDEAIVEPSGATRRYGLDISLRYQITNNFYFDFDYNYAHGRFINEPEGANFIPLAPTHTSIGGLTYKPLFGWAASLRYRYISDRPANEDNSVTALGYFICDAAISYRFASIEVFIKLENLFNTEWNEAQFDTESRLRAPDENGDFIGELEPHSISELHYTPGSPFWLRGGVSITF